MYYKVFISTAGVGSRLSGFTSTNKALLPIKYEAVIQKIIKKFPKKIEIVVAVGYQKQKIIDFLNIRFPDRNLKLVETKKYKGKGSGTGYTLLKCRKYLQCPFIYSSSDTLVAEKISAPNRNWVGISKVYDPSQFLIIKKNKDTYSFLDKKKINKKNKQKKYDAFIGLAGIFDYKKFWNGLLKDRRLIKGELQISNGLNLLSHNLKLVNFSWSDTGTIENYKKTLLEYNDDTLIKPDTAIYFSNDLVIKYFADNKKIKDLRKRAKILEKFVPKIIEKTKNFLVYKFQKGNLLSNSSIRRFDDFIYFLFNNFWRKKDYFNKNLFYQDCHAFYKVKTFSRINSFLKRYKINDQIEYINGYGVPKVYDLLSSIDWNYLNKGIPVNFHGDLQPENIINKKDYFILIDWRERFGRSLYVGDIYYEFSKLDHALEINGEIIRKKKFSYKKIKNKITYSFEKKIKLLKFRKLLHKSIIDKRYDIKKVKLLTSLIFLNIAIFYEKPYSHLLFSHGKLMLAKNLQLIIK